MFHRNRRGSAHMPKHHPSNQRPAANPTAASAATQAFLNSQKSDATLSAAAAAAALRAHPTTPSPVANVQTKRMQRRESIGSVKSQPGADSARPTLQRKGSSGSMTERTFRTPSPNRGSPARGPGNDIPPVPAVPTEVRLSPVSQRPRASSMVQQPRLNSPISMKPGGRGVSLDTGSRPNGAQAPPQSQRLQQIQELSRENSRKSINFSRPISPQLNNKAPGSSSPTPKQSGWFTGPVVSGKAPRHEINIQRQSIGAVQAKPVQIQEGSHLSKLDQSRLSTTRKSAEPEGVISQVGPNSSNGTQAPSGLAASKWSPAKPIANGISSHTTPGELFRKALNAQHSISIQPQGGEVPTSSEPLQALVQPPVSSSPDTSPQPARSASLGHEAGRSPSKSPTRNAHFLNATSPMLNGLRHEPPGRSASPVKPAIKHYRSASARTNSPPMGLHGEQNNITDEILAASEGSSNRKKSVRVSFEEPNPDSTSGLESSRFAPGKMARSPTEALDEPLDHIMKPRPELPSFGSVRRQNRSGDNETRGSNPRANLEESTHSSDHAVGGILRQNLLAGKGTRVTSPMLSNNDPLPPEVTSVEGTGLSSDSDSDLAMSGAIQPTLPEPIVEEKPKEPVQEKAPQVTKDVPKLILQPPTPAAEVERPLQVPGAFPDSSSEDSPMEDDKFDQAQVASGIQFVDDSDGSTSDNESIYSDAEEDLDHEGFASLDAVLEASTNLDAPGEPQVVTQKVDVHRPIPESFDTITLSERLDDAQISSKEQFIDPASPEEESTITAPRPVETKQPRILNNSPTDLNTTPAIAPAPLTGLAASKWSLSNMKTKPPAQATQARSPAQPPVAARPIKKSLRNSNAPASAIIPLQRSDSAGSASSFQRRRITSSNKGGKMPFRKTMRGDPDVQESQRPTSPSVWSADNRARSPNGAHHMRPSLRTFSGQSTAPSLRNKDAKQRAKSPSRFSSIMKFAKPKASRPAPEAGGSRFKSRFDNDSDDDEPRRTFVSRFDDSDDEEVVNPPKLPILQTPNALPPVRGIPRRDGEQDGDSTDLSDDDSYVGPPPEMPLVPSSRDIDAAHTPSPPPGASPVAGSGKPVTGLFASKYAPQPGSSPRPADKKARLPSFFSTLGGDSLSHKRTISGGFRSGGGGSRPAPKERVSSFEGRNVQGGKLRRKQPSNNASTAPVSNAQKHSIVGADEEKEWPLAEKRTPAVEADERPSTADGTVGGQRPALLDIEKRQSAADNVLDLHDDATLNDSIVAATEERNDGIGSGGKKKKRFGKLRKAFGMKG